MAKTDQSSELTAILRDFVFKDRRIGDQRTISAAVYLADGRVLSPAAAVGKLTDREIEYCLPSGRTKEPMSVSNDPPVAIEFPSRAEEVWSPKSGGDLGRFQSPESSRSVLASPIFDGDTVAGSLSLSSSEGKTFREADISRVQVLSALVAYELFHLGRQRRDRSRISEELGHVLHLAREELGLTREELAQRIGTSRIALSRWEVGAQAPSRGPLKRWAEALGLLAGGRPEIITIADITPQLIDLLQRDPLKMHELSPAQFEGLVAERLEMMGYGIQRTGSATLRDGGIDLIAVPKTPAVASFLLAVQVKHHRDFRKTGRGAVDQLLAWQGTAFQLGMLVTNTSFTRDAIWKAAQAPSKHFLRLRDFTDLTRWLHGIFDASQEWREIPDAIELAPGIFARIPKPTFAEAVILWPGSYIRNK